MRAMLARLLGRKPRMWPGNVGFFSEEEIIEGDDRERCSHHDTHLACKKREKRDHWREPLAKFFRGATGEYVNGERGVVDKGVPAEESRCGVRGRDGGTLN